MQAEHQEGNITGANFRTPKFLKLLTGILLVMFPVGLFIMFSGMGKQFLWTTTIFLGLEAIIMLFLLIKISDMLSAISGAVIILFISFFIEWYGVNTGLPFGSYAYTDVLQPKLYGVPVAITFAWFVVTSSSLVVSKYFGGSGFSIAFISGALILATDVLLEPFASFVNSYWQWESFRIPIQNFLAWFVLGYLFSLSLNKVLKWNSGISLAKITIPSIIISINVINFSIVNLANSYYVLTITGLMIFIIVIGSAVFFKPKVKRM